MTASKVIMFIGITSLIWNFVNAIWPPKGLQRGQDDYWNRW